jgi:hypothetical protein
MAEAEAGGLDASVDEGEGEDVVKHEADHFVELDECVAALRVICTAAVAEHGAARPRSPGSGSARAAAAARPEEVEAGKVEAILQKYQEQPHLLDRHLEGLVALLMGACKSVLRLRERDGSCSSSLPFQVYSNAGLQLVFKVLYQLCTVRGRKSVVKHMPHEVSDLEPALQLLQSQDVKDFSTWETRYCLLLWLSSAYTRSLFSSSAFCLESSGD